MTNCNQCIHDDLGYRNCCRGVYRPEIYISPIDDCTEFEPLAEVE